LGVAAAVLGIVTTTPMLLLASFLAPAGVFVGVSLFARGLAAHAVASFKLRLLEAGSKLPEARLLSDGGHSHDG
jgi:hypothetical protein